jgi:hypothetical protein
MRPIKAKDLLELDQNMKVVMIRQTQLPQTLVYQGGKNDYSEEPIHTKFPQQKMNVVNGLLSNYLQMNVGTGVHWSILRLLWTALDLFIM